MPILFRPSVLQRACAGFALALIAAFSPFAATASVPIHTGQIDLIPGAEASNYQVTVYDATTNTWYIGSQENTVAVVDGATGLVTAQITLPSAGARAMALDAAAHRLYAAGDGDLAVIDTVAKTATSITLPHGGSQGVAVDPGLHRCYVTSGFANELAIINTLTNAVVSTITTGTFPSGVAVNPGSHTVYVACRGDISTPNSGKLSFIDPTLSTPAEFDLIVQDGTSCVAVNPGNNRLYFSASTNFGATNSVRIVNVTSGLDTTVPTAFVKGLLVDPSGSGKVYALDSSSTVHVIATDNTDTSFTATGAIGLGASSTSIATVQYHELDYYSLAGTLSSVVPLHAAPGAMAINPQTNKIYVVNTTTRSLFVVDAATQKTLKTLTFDTTLGGVAVNAVTNRVYLLIPSDPVDGIARLVAIDGSDDHVIYDDVQLTVLTDAQNQVFQSFSPTKLAVDSVHNRIYVVQNNDPGYITMVNGAEERAGHDPVDHTGIDNVGSSPYALFVDGASNTLVVGTYVYSGDHNAAAIILKPPQNGAPTATVFDGGPYDANPFADLLYNSATNRIYAAGSNPTDGSHEAKVFAPGPGNLPYSVSKRFPLPGNYFGGQLALNASLNRVYVTGASLQGHVLRTITNEALDASYDSTQNLSVAIGFDATRGNVYVAGRPSVIDPQQVGGLVDIYFDGADTVPPVTSVVTPADGTSISALLLTYGTVNVSDARSEVASVQVSLRNAQGQYWDGTQWVANEVFLTATAGANGDWTFKFPTRAQGLVKGIYTLHVQATDAASNVKNVSSQFTIITPGEFSFGNADYTVAETAGSIQITVQRANGTDGPVDVGYSAFDGTANRFEGAYLSAQTGGYVSFGDYDYAATPLDHSGLNEEAVRTLHFADGQTSKSFSMNVSDDELREGDQHVTLVLRDITPGAELGQIPEATLTLTDDTRNARVTNLGAVRLLPYGGVKSPVALCLDAAHDNLYVAGTGESGSRIGIFDVTTGLQKGAINVNAGTPDSLGNTLGVMAIDVAKNRLYLLASPHYDVISQAKWAVRSYTLDTLRHVSDALLPAYSVPSLLRLDSQSHLLYIATATGVLEFDPETSLFLRTLAGANRDGGGVSDFAIDHANNRLVTYADGAPFDHPATVFFVNLQSAEVTPVQTELYTGKFAFDATHSRAYLVGSGDGTTNSHVLRTITAAGAISDIALPSEPAGVTVDETNNIVYVGEAGTTNGEAGTNLHKFTGGATPVDAGNLPGSRRLRAGGGMVAAPGVHRVFLASSGTSVDFTNEIGTVDTQSGAIGRIVTAASPFSVAAAHTVAGEKVYATDGVEDVVWVVDGATNTLLKQLAAGSIPGSAAGIDSTGKVHFLTYSALDQDSHRTVQLRTIDTASDTVDAGAPNISAAGSFGSGAPAFRLMADDTAKALFTGTQDGFGAGGLYRIDADPSHNATYRHVTHTQAAALDSLVYNPVRHRLYGIQNALVSGHTQVSLKVYDGSDLTGLGGGTLGTDIFFHTKTHGAAIDPARDVIFFPILSLGKTIEVVDVKPGDQHENQVIELFNVDTSVDPYNNFPEFGLQGAVVNPATHHVYIGDIGGPGGHGAAIVLDSSTTGVQASTAVTPNLSEIGDGVAFALDTANQNVYVANSTNGTVTVLHDEGAELAPLPKPLNLSYDVSDPIAGIPWAFSVTENSTAAGLAVVFQYSTDTGISWHTLPGTVDQAGTKWTLTTGGVPAGTVNFRALASAPNFMDKASDTVGPVTVGQGTPPPTGKVVIFGAAEFAGAEGATITVTVLRGTDSIGQVVAPFQVGGTAIRGGAGVKTFDYTLEPANTLLTFHEGEFVQQITIIVAASKGSEPAKTIDLRLQNPIGDAYAGEPAQALINLVDGKPSLLKVPSVPKVAPTNVVSTDKHTKVKTVRNGSAWNFDVVEPAAAGATDLEVWIQRGNSTTGPWTDLLQLHAQKASHWTNYTDTIPEGPTTFFRAIARATGFTAQPGPATASGFIAVPGPDLTVTVTAVSGPDGSGQHLPPRNNSASDAFEGEVIEYHFQVANNGDASATGAVLSVAIPKHTTYLNSTTSGATAATVPDKKGRTALVNFTFGAIGQQQTYEEAVLVQVDAANGFSTKDSAAGFGQVLTMDTFKLFAVNQGVLDAVKTVPKLETRVVGPLDLVVTGAIFNPDSGQVKVREGGVIEYTLACTNNGTSGLQDNVVTDHFPAGSALEQLFAPDADGSSTSQKLPNPGPLSNPQLLYVFDPKGPPLDLGQITSAPLAKAAIKAFKDTAAEYDFVEVRAAILKTLGDAGHSADISQFDDLLTRSVAAHTLLPSGVRWRIAGIAPQHTVTLKYQAHVLFGLQKLGAAAPTAIVNGGTLPPPKKDVPGAPFYDFTSVTQTGAKPASALYGRTPPAITIPLDLTTENSHPVLSLKRETRGDHNLSDPSHFGNGASYLAGFGLVVTAVAGPDHGFDYELKYRNDGDAAADNVVIHEQIPAGAELLGFFKQSVNGGAEQPMNNAAQFSFYDAKGNLMASVDGATIKQVRSMDLRLSPVSNLTPLNPNDYGVIRYTLHPTIPATNIGGNPPAIVAAGGYQPQLNKTDPYQGAYITADGFATDPEGCTPSLLAVRVVADVSFSPACVTQSGRATPGADVVQDVSYSQDGDVLAEQAHVLFTLLPGTTISAAAPPHFTHRTGAGTSTGDQIIVTVRNQTVDLALGNVPAHGADTIRISLHIASPLDPDLAKIGAVWLKDAKVGVIKDLAKRAPAPHGRHEVAAQAGPTLRATTDIIAQPVPLNDQTPTLMLGRSAPYTLQNKSKENNTNITYVITFANVGDMDATGVQLGMQIPYGTAFANYDDAGVLFLNGHGVSGAGGAPTHTDRTPEQVKLSGPSADVVTWHIGTLPAHSSGAIKLRAHVIFDFLDNSVRDHSLYISASNARSVVVSPDPIGTWISSRTFAASKGSILPKVLENLRISGGSDPQLNQVLTDYLGTMTANAQLDSIAGADALLLLEGQRIIPLGNNQALVIDSTGTGSTKTLSGATMLVNSGPTRVAAGPADKIQIDNLALNVRAAAGVSGSGIPTCADLLAHAIDVANAQGADIQRSKANNLVNDDSGSPVLVSNTNGLGLSLVPKNVVMVQAGVSTVGKVAGNITAVGGVVSDLVKLRPQEGGTTVTGTNAGLAVTSNGGVYNNAGHIVAQGAGNVISNDGGTIVAAGGGNAVSKDGQAFASDGGADLVNTNGSNIVAQGGLNLTPSGTAGLVSEGGAQLVSHGSSVIGENSSGIVGQGGGN